MIRGPPKVPYSFFMMLLWSRVHNRCLLFTYGLSLLLDQSFIRARLCQFVHYSQGPAHGGCLIQMCLNGEMNDATPRTRFHSLKSISRHIRSSNGLGMNSVASSPASLQKRLQKSNKDRPPLQGINEICEANF